jgi:hypothetical protein
MKRHELDVISLVSGLLFTGLGAVFALHALDVFSIDVRAVPAVVLIVLGIGGIAAALTSSVRSAAPAPVAAGPQPDSPGSGPAVPDSVPEP